MAEKQDIIKQKRKRYKFNVMREKMELKNIIKELPKEDEVYKIISGGGFSSIAFIKLMSDETVINQLYASTLRIGKKHLQILDSIHKKGQLYKANFIVGTLMKNDSDYVKKFGYYDDLESVCEKNGWVVQAKNNHSKIILFDTDLGKYVLETSSNLNENPKVEQFSFEKSEELFDFYEKIFIGDIYG